MGNQICTKHNCWLEKETDHLGRSLVGGGLVCPVCEEVAQEADSLGARERGHQDRGYDSVELPIMGQLGWLMG